MSDAGVAMEFEEPQLVSQEEPQEMQQEGDEPSAKKGKRSKDQGQDRERLAKRPRWVHGDKAFEEINIADVETLVRRCNSLEKKVEENKDAVLQLSELQSEKKALEKEMVAIGSDEVANVKASIAKNLRAQMSYVFAWDADLNDTGRSITAFVPNVSLQLLKALGGTVGEPQQKRTLWYFDTAPTKKVQPTRKKGEKPSGSGLVLEPFITLKYIKTTSELQLSAVYKFGDIEKQVKPTPKKCKKSKEEGEDMAGEDGEDAEDANEKDADDMEMAADEGIAVGGQ